MHLTLYSFSLYCSSTPDMDVLSKAQLNILKIILPIHKYPEKYKDAYHKVLQNQNSWRIPLLQIPQAVYSYILLPCTITFPCPFPFLIRYT